MITDNLTKGGKERRLLELLKIMDCHAEDPVELIILKDVIKYQEIYDLKNIRLHVFNRKVKKDLSVFFRIWLFCSAYKPDIIHSWGSMPSIYVFLICRIKGISFLNGMISNAICKPYSQDWIRAKITFPFSDIILANSFAGIKAFRVPEKKARVIYNGVHLDRFNIKTNVENIRKKFNIHTKYIVGMVAAFQPRKDYDTFIKAAIRITGNNDDITFLGIGDGENLEDMKNKVPGHLLNRILLLGRQDKIEEIINTFDIGVLLTNDLFHKEGISNSILEYMALGKAVIATKGGGTDELINNNENGILISPANIDELINNIELILKSETTRKQLGQKARETIEKNFTIDKMYESYIQIYSNLQNKKKYKKTRN